MYKLIEFAKKEPELYSAISLFLAFIIYIFFMVGDLVIKGKSNLNPLLAIPLLPLSVYFAYKYYLKKK